MRKSRQTNTFIKISYFGYLPIGVYVHFLCIACPVLQGPKKTNQKKGHSRHSVFCFAKTAACGLNLI